MLYLSHDVEMGGLREPVVSFKNRLLLVFYNGDESLLGFYWQYLAHP